MLFQSIYKIVEEIDTLLRLRITHFRKRDFKRQNVVRAKTWIDIGQAIKTFDQQSRASKQNQSGCDCHKGKTTAQAIAAGNANAAFEFLRHRFSNILKRRKKSD